MISFDNIFTYDPQRDYFIADKEPFLLFPAGGKQPSIDDNIFYVINKKFDDIVSDELTHSCIVCAKRIKSHKGYISTDNVIAIHKKCRDVVDKIIHKRSFARLYLKSGGILYSHHIYLINRTTIITASKGIFREYILTLDVLNTDAGDIRESFLFKLNVISFDCVCDTCGEEAKYEYLNYNYWFYCCEECRRGHDKMKFKLIYIKYICDQLLIVDVSNKIVNKIIDIYQQFMPS